MIFLPSGVSFTLWQAAYSATFGLRGWPVPLTPKAKRYFLRVTIVGGNATRRNTIALCAVRVIT